MGVGDSPFSGLLSTVQGVALQMFLTAGLGVAITHGLMLRPFASVAD